MYRVVGSLTAETVTDVTAMSWCRRVAPAVFAGKHAEARVVSPLVRAVHVGALVVCAVPSFAACVVPPPIDTEFVDAGLNSAPVITEVRDPALNPLRPPAVITLDTTPIGNLPELGVTLYDRDADDELFLQLFVDYVAEPAEDAVVNCQAFTSGTGSPVRTTNCSTSNLCARLAAPPEGRLEIEVYDREPIENAPYRTPTEDGLFSTWTFTLRCVDQP